MGAVVKSTLSAAKAQIELLDQRDSWTSLLSKDVPVEVTQWVTDQLRAGKDLDQIKDQLGMRSGADPRWRKIMSCIRTGKRVDATAVFVKWMERTESLSDKLNHELEEQFKFNKPMNRMVLQGLMTLSQLQLNTVRLGKELGVFVDPGEKGQSGQGVTIVVQTNVPMPSAEKIFVHQAEVTKRNIELLESNRPDKDK